MKYSLQYYEMSYGLNVEMHKQTEICKRLDAIIRQVLPFLSGEVCPIFHQHLNISNNLSNINIRAQVLVLIDIIDSTNNK